MSALGFALTVAALNVAVSWAIEKRSKQLDANLYWWWQGAGSLFRCAAIFGAAHLLWSFNHRAGEVVVFLFAGVILQLAGEIYFFAMRKS